MQQDYPLCLPRLLTHEGGYTNDPRDPGGPTNWGITIYDARRYWKAGATAEDVRSMPLSVAQAIYDTKYWHAMWCHLLPAGVDDVIFDYGVNSGNSRAIKVLQRTVNSNTVNGVMSTALLQAVQGVRPGLLIDSICDERLRFLHSLSTWDHFGVGWGRRVAEVRAFAHQLDAGHVPTMPIPDATIQAAGKGHVAPLSKTQGGTSGTIVVAGTSTATQMHAAGHDPLVILGVVAGTVVLAGGAYLAFEWYHRHRQDAPA